MSCAVFRCCGERCCVAIHRNPIHRDVFKELELKRWVTVLRVIVLSLCVCACVSVLVCVPYARICLIWTDCAGTAVGAC